MNFKKISNYIISILQICIFMAVILLEYFSRNKMGVIRYVVYKNHEFQTTIFSPQFIMLFKTLLLVSTALFVILLILAYTKAKYSVNKTISIIGALISAFGIVIFFFGEAFNLKSLPFFMLAVLIIVIIQFIKLVINILYFKN